MSDNGNGAQDPNSITRSNVVPNWALPSGQALLGAGLSGGTGDAEYEEEQFLSFYKQSKFRKRCVRCATRYLDIESVGRHQCLYHPGTFNYDMPGRNHGRYQYECCGMTDDPYSTKRKYQEGFPKGCTRADHTRLDTRYIDRDDIVVPMSYANQFTFFQETSKLVAAGTKIRIYRRDWRTERRRMMTGNALPDSPGPEKEQELTPIAYVSSMADVVA